MRAKIINIKQEKTKQGYLLYHIFLDSMGKDGTYDTYTGPVFRNFNRWQQVIKAFNEGCEIWLDGLVVKNQVTRIVNADSPFFWYRRIEANAI